MAFNYRGSTRPAIVVRVYKVQEHATLWQGRHPCGDRVEMELKHIVHAPKACRFRRQLVDLAEEENVDMAGWAVLDLAPVIALD